MVGGALTAGGGGFGRPMLLLWNGLPLSLGRLLLVGGSAEPRLPTPPPKKSGIEAPPPAPPEAPKDGIDPAPPEAPKDGIDEVEDD